MNKQQAKAQDLLKNLGKTESQESPKEDKWLLSKAIQIVKRILRNKLPEVIEAYRAEKDHELVVQRESDYDNSFVRINKQEFKLEPGKDFNYKGTGINICITYKNNDEQQQRVPGAVMNIKINDIEYNIQPGKIWRYDNNGLVVDVVPQGMDINQSQEVAGKDVAKVKAKVLQGL